MAIDRQALALSAADRLSVELANRLTDAWRTVPPCPETGDKEAGRAVAVALSTLPVEQAAMQLDCLSLTGVQLQMDPPRDLVGGDVFGHPLIGEWVHATFPDMIGDAIRAGRIGAALGPAGPIYDSFRIIEVDGAIRVAVVGMSFETKMGRLPVQAIYGAYPATGHQRSNMLLGDNLVAVGSDVAGTAPGASDDTDNGGLPPGPPLTPAVH